MGGLTESISAHCHNLDFGQAVVTTDKQRVDGRCNKKKWERTVFRDSVAKWKPDGYRLKTDLFFDVPGLQNLQFKITITSENLNISLEMGSVKMTDCLPQPLLILEVDSTLDFILQQITAALLQ